MTCRPNLIWLYLIVLHSHRLLAIISNISGCVQDKSIHEIHAQTLVTSLLLELRNASRKQLFFLATCLIRGEMSHVEINQNQNIMDLCFIIKWIVKLYVFFSPLLTKPPVPNWLQERHLAKRIFLVHTTALKVKKTTTTKAHFLVSYGPWCSVSI